MIVTLCGSMRYEDQFKMWNERLTFAGHTVFTVTAYPSDKSNNKDWYTPEQKINLDKAHMRKIDASDAILVIGDYIGESTTNEIAHAIAANKRIYYTYAPPHTHHDQVVCPYAGCSDPLVMRPPCSLCYE